MANSDVVLKLSDIFSLLFLLCKFIINRQMLHYIVNSQKSRVTEKFTYIEISFLFCQLHWFFALPYDILVAFGDLTDNKYIVNRGMFW